MFNFIHVFREAAQENQKQIFVQKLCAAVEGILLKTLE
jgi:hypothetical protein